MKMEEMYKNIELICGGSNRPFGNIKPTWSRSWNTLRTRYDSILPRVGSPKLGNGNARTLSSKSTRIEYRDFLSFYSSKNGRQKTVGSNPTKSLFWGCSSVG
tara:strand:- start:824 stop:1129 length:306 start_codon:yes stop_codon:yes gene_type:complete